MRILVVAPQDFQGYGHGGARETATKLQYLEGWKVVSLAFSTFEDFPSNKNFWTCENKEKIEKYLVT